MPVPDRVLVAAVGGTLVGLLADFRLDAAPVSELIPVTQHAANAGREVHFEQLVGWHGIVWVLGFLVLLHSRAHRRQLFTAPAILMMGVAAAIPAVAAATAEIDSLTVESLLGVGLPLACMTAVVLHPAVSRHALWISIWLLATTTGLLIAATVAKGALSGSIPRLGIAFFGPTTSTGPVLAALALMVLLGLPPKGRPRALGIALFIVLVAGVGLTQSRGSAVALLMGLGVVGLLARNVPGRAVALTGLFAVAVLAIAPRSLLTAGEANNVRAQSLSYHWRLFLEQPSLGYGVTKGTLSASAGAHNSVLAVALGTGAYGAVAFVGAWVSALVGAARQHLVVGSSVFATYIVGWVLTGGEVLFQIPVTNLLPLALACAATKRAGSPPP